MTEIDQAFLTLLVRWVAVVLCTIYVITESSIFMPIRVAITKGTIFTRTLFYCPACMGFWVGVFYAFFSYWPFDYGREQLDVLRECAESGAGGLVLGAIWGQWHHAHAFADEATLRGEDPETFLPYTQPDDVAANEGDDDHDET